MHLREFRLYFWQTYSIAGSSTAAHVALLCSQTRRRLSLVRLLLPLPSTLEHRHLDDRLEHNHHHPLQDPLGILEADSEADSSPSNSKENIILNVLLLSSPLASRDCPMQISGVGGKRLKTLRFAWSDGPGLASSAVGDGRMPPLPLTNAESRAAAAPPPSLHPPAISVQRMTAPLFPASSPPFFQISNSLQLPPYPLNRHVTLFPPCVTAQVRPPCTCFNLHLHVSS